MALLYEEYNNIQASIDVDALFAAKLQQEEREQFTIKERAQFLVETIAAQRKFRAAQRAAEIKSKTPTKGQLRNLMMTYLKHMGGYKHNQLKGKTYEELQRLYERQQKSIQDFKPMDTEEIKDSAKKDDSTSKPVEGSLKKKTPEERIDSTKKSEKLQSEERPAGGIRRKTIVRKRIGAKIDKDSAKRQKTEATAEEQESVESDKEEIADSEQEKEKTNSFIKALYLVKVCVRDSPSLNLKVYNFRSMTLLSFTSEGPS
ncbi:hypothetical protein Tco_1245098 [Tanacetum coccineum]